MHSSFHNVTRLGKKSRSQKEHIKEHIIEAPCSKLQGIFHHQGSFVILIAY